MENNNAKMIAAIAAAVLAGTVLGLIFAPAKGQDTRQNFAGGAKDLAEKLKKKISNKTADTIH
jgi:gas vesicle protein